MLKYIFIIETMDFQYRYFVSFLDKIYNRRFFGERTFRSNSTSSKTSKAYGVSQKCEGMKERTEQWLGI